MTEQPQTIRSGTIANHIKMLDGSRPGVMVGMNFRTLVLRTVSLPLSSLLFCFLYSMIFQYKDVVDVESCKGVHNFIPSISAVTSAKPGAYTWKISIALHVGPRLMICSAYYNFFLHRLKNIPQHWRDNYLLAVSVTYWLNIIENLSLVGVTYITNLDNYPVHEKLFITFMGTSTAYMVFTVLLLKYSNTVAPWMSTDLWSYRVKIICLLLILIFSAGMGIFFYYHRMYCQPKAFSYFSLCEYWVCVSNMAFHASSIYDFPDSEVLLMPEPRKSLDADGKSR